MVAFESISPCAGSASGSIYAAVDAAGNRNMIEAAIRESFARVKAYETRCNPLNKLFCRNPRNHFNLQ